MVDFAKVLRLDSQRHDNSLLFPDKSTLTAALYHAADHPAIYLQGGPGDVVCGVRKQKYRRPAELIGIAIAPQRNRTGSALLLLLDRNTGLLAVDLIQLAHAIGRDAAR